MISPLTIPALAAGEARPGALLTPQGKIMIDFLITEVPAGHGGGFLIDVPRPLVCESKSRQRRFCGAGITHGVTLNKQLSGTPCEQGSSWGWDSRGVWVDKGCRAEFAVN